MTDLASDSTALPVRRSRGFVLGYGAAQAGAFVAFIPLLTLLLPEKAAVLGGDDKAVLLGQVAMAGGLTAAAANLAFGALSDRTRNRWGRRRPWILCGLAFVVMALALTAVAADPLMLVLSVVVFQIAVNALYAPLTALVPDMVPDRQKGLVSAWAGGALPVANLFTALVVTRLIGQPIAAFAAVALATSVLVLPFAMTLRESEAAPAAPRRTISLAVLRDAIFRRAFGSRLLIESAVAIHTLYLLFRLQGLPAGGLPAGWSAPQAFGVMLLVSTLAAAVVGFLGGALSDRVRHRRPFVVAGALCMALALVLIAGRSDWLGLLIAQGLFGVGHGLHAATVSAMTAEILPDKARAGQDLGVMNMAVALPQALAPGAAAVLLSQGSTLPVLFYIAGAASCIASVMLVIRWPRRQTFAGASGI